MGGSKLLSKTEYDLKAICFLPMTYPKLCNIKGGGGGGLQHPATQITTRASVQMPHRLAQVENRVTTCTILFSREGGRQFMRGAQALT